MSFLCPYCGELKEDDRRTVEHPVPARIGGNLEIETCDECNEGAAQVIDNPVLFRDGDVRALRPTYDVRSPRRRGRPSRDEFIGQFSGQDAKAAWRPSPAGGEVVQLTATDPTLEEDGTFTVIAPEDQAEKHLERTLAKLRAAHPGKTVELLSTERQSGDEPPRLSWRPNPLRG
jgi:HNH endonuclease